MQKKVFNKKHIRLAINIIVLIVCIWLLYSKFNLTDVANHLANLNYSIFIFTVLISVFRIWLTGLRWEALHPDNETRLSKWNYFRFSMIAHLFNLFMPGALGGDIVKTVYAVKEQKKKKIKSVIAVLVDRVVGLISILIFGILALFLTRKIHGFDLSKLIIIFIIVIALLVVSMNKRVITYIEGLIARISFLQKFLGAIIRNWSESVSYYGANRKKVVYAFLLCLPIHLISFAIYYIFSQSIGMEISFFEIVFAVAIMWLITALPVSIGGIGVRELSLIWLLGMFNVLPEIVIILSMMVYINGIMVSILSLPLLFDLRKKSKSHISTM